MNVQWVQNGNHKNVSRINPEQQWELDPRDFEHSLYEGLPQKREEGVNWTMVLVAVILTMLMVYSSMTGYLYLLPQPITPTPMPGIT